MLCSKVFFVDYRYKINKIIGLQELKPVENSRINFLLTGIRRVESSEPKNHPLYTQDIRVVYMGFSTVSQWLAWILSIHNTEIELGLDRVQAVADRLKIKLPGVKIIVAGTNGKGSTVAGLEAIYRAEGYQVGAFTSPILFKHNEQVRINGEPASDEAFCLAFERIEKARQNDISLTAFEFFTLAAFLIFQDYPLDVVLLEVGLGGRLDAVNIIDADVAVVTCIDLDHTDRLGNTRYAIGREKAGIFRHNKPVVCGDSDPPLSLLECAERLHAPFYCQGRDFFFQEAEQSWSFTHQTTLLDLPLNALAKQNMATALMTIALLQKQLPVTRQSIDRGLTEVKLAGRIQIIDGPVTEIYDVSHNPAAVAWLSKQLQKMPCQGKTHAVFSMLADKDITQSIERIRPMIDSWYVAPLADKRGAGKQQLANALRENEVHDVDFFASIEEAYKYAVKTAASGERILIFGSFRTVAEAWINRKN